MNAGSIEIDGGQRSFAPGEEVAGTVTWRLEGDPDEVELRLFWHTQGRGDSDVETIAIESYGAPGAGDKRPFHFRLPAGPYTFSGKLISLLWGLELVAEPYGAVANVEITVSPTGGEVRIGRPEEPGES